MRVLLALLLSALLAASAAAQQPRTYAIASLVADGILVVRYDLGTGSNIPRNPRRFTPLATSELDHAVLFAVEDAVRKNDPLAKTVLLAAKDPELFKSPGEAGAPAAVRLAPQLAAIRPMAAKAGATHLLLATKHRDEARIRFDDSTVGKGPLEGVGFYVDTEMRVGSRESGLSAIGFIAPFAYVNLALVDIATGSVLREETFRDARPHVSSTGAGPWEMHSGQEKAAMLKRMLQDGVSRAILPLLAS